MDKYRIEIPEFCLVALVGGTSSGKTSFALRHFKPTEVLSSDFFRGMVCDDENSQSISGDAFDLLYYAANKRLNNMKMTVIDATNSLKISKSSALSCGTIKRTNTDRLTSSAIFTADVTSWNCCSANSAM